MWFGTGVEKGVWCARPTRFSIRNVLISFWYHYGYFSFTQLCFPQTKSFTVFLEQLIFSSPLGLFVLFLRFQIVFMTTAVSFRFPIKCFYLYANIPK